MSLASVPVPFEPRPVRSIALPRIGRAELDAARLVRSVRGAGRVRGELARAGREVLESVVTAAARPCVVLESGTVRHRMEPGQVELAEEAIDPRGAGFELRRGRSTVRIVRTGRQPVLRNGWELEAGAPVSLYDGDLVTSRGRCYSVALAPPGPRPTVEIGPARMAEGPSPDAVRFGYVLEPAGEPVVLACDGGSARAILDLLAAGAGDRPFDPTVLGDVESAVVEWAIGRFAHSAVRAVLGHASALRAVPVESVTPGIWLAAAARVGAFCGVWWLGATRRAFEIASPHVAARTRAALLAHPVLLCLDAELCARVPLGRLAACAVAGLEPGDLLVSRADATRNAEGVRGAGVLALAAGCDLYAGAELEPVGQTIRAIVGGARTTERRETVQQREDATLEGPGPFDMALEEIGVTVSVEVGRRRVPLVDILTLAPGDVIELHAPVQNDVRITIDGTPFARGELVDADGALAVRVLALGGRP
jgi:flagellar motor switch/type III secretory pathway protein FliN